MSTPTQCRAKCHCGAVVIEAELTEGLTPNRCDCSFCSRRGAAAVTASASSLRILQGADNLTFYSWGTQAAKHYFCKTCGIYSHHQRRSNPNECGINLGNIDGVYVPDFDPIDWVDGVNHPSDSKT